MAKKTTKSVKRTQYYVAWVDSARDPWPGWRHSEWKEIFPSQSDELGSWPGVPFVGRGERKLLCIGPTLLALFHTAIPYSDVRDWGRIYLLYPPDDPQRPHDNLKDTLERIARARKIKDWEQIVQFVPVPGLSDTSDQKSIVEVLMDWIDGPADPFERSKTANRRIVVNLSAGPPILQSCWTHIDWQWVGREAKGGSTEVQFVQECGDVRMHNLVDDQRNTELFDVIPAWPRGQEELPQISSGSEVADFTVRLQDLQHRKYAEVRGQIERAAALGLPILLHGERGTGKTFLAQHYHDLRQSHRRDGSSGRQSAGQLVESRRSKSPVCRLPKKKHSEPRCVRVTLSEYDSKEDLRAELFGWKRGSFTGSEENYDGLLGEAHEGTLFLDEIHHLHKKLQAALLGPLNDGTYRPKGQAQSVWSDFDLVVATNAPNWENMLRDDFRDRLNAVIIETPSFEELLDDAGGPEDIWRFWDATLRGRCRASAIKHVEETAECREGLMHLFQEEYKVRPRWPGNWRDLQRLAGHVLIKLVDTGTKTLAWDAKKLDEALLNAFPKLEEWRRMNEFGQLPRKSLTMRDPNDETDSTSNP